MAMKQRFDDPAPRKRAAKKAPAKKAGATKSAAKKAPSGVVAARSSGVMRDGRTVKPAAATKRASLGSGRKWARKSAGIRETPEYYAWNDPDAPVEMSAAERQRLNQVALGVSGRAELEAEARRLVDLRHRLAFITDVAGSKSAAAELLGVDPSQTTRWAKGDSNPGPVQVRRLIDLDHVLAHAALVWSTESLVRDWLTTSNAHLEGARPIDYLRLHGAADVIGALRAEAAGSYA